MILIDRSESRVAQLKKQTERCYDDYCFYNQYEPMARERFVQERMEEYKEQEFVIPYLPVYLTTACSLNCKKCNNLMPLFHGHAADFSWEKTKESFERVLASVKEIIFCELVGGEPFLYKNLDKALDYVGSQKKIRQIVIVTNGTVIPNDSIIQKLHDLNVLVRVSDYGLFEKMSLFVAKLDKYGVNVRIQQDMKWNDPGDIEKRGKTEDELKKQYNACEFSLKCKYLCEDKLFTCARAASLYHLGLFDDDRDILSINNNNMSTDMLRNFYLHEEGSICDYCDLFTSKGVLIPAAEQVGNASFTHSNYTVISNYELNHFKHMTKEYERFLASQKKGE